MKELKHFILAAVFALAAGMSSAQEVDRDPTIGATIQRQMEAFLADDLAAAFAVASPTIQRLFETPENFGRMVAQGYPMVRRPADVKYLEQRQHADAVMQMVRVTDSAGGIYWFAYEMVLIAGDWRINGVFPIAPPAANV